MHRPPLGTHSPPFAARSPPRRRPSPMSATRSPRFPADAPVARTCAPALAQAAPRRGLRRPMLRTGPLPLAAHVSSLAGTAPAVGARSVRVRGRWCPPARTLPRRSVPSPAPRMHARPTTVRSPSFGARAPAPPPPPYIRKGDGPALPHTAPSTHANPAAPPRAHACTDAGWHTPCFPAASAGPEFSARRATHTTRAGAAILARARPCKRERSFV